MWYVEGSLRLQGPRRGTAASSVLSQKLFSGPVGARGCLRGAGGSYAPKPSFLYSSQHMLPSSRACVQGFTLLCPGESRGGTLTPSCSHALPIQPRGSRWPEKRQLNTHQGRGQAQPARLGWEGLLLGWGAVWKEAGRGK